MSLEETMKPLQRGQIFASFKHVDAFLANGALPAIHANMGVIMDSVPADERNGVLDLGACHGLLSVRARKLGWQMAIGVEADQRSVDAFNQFVRPLTTGIVLEQKSLDVTADTFPAWLLEQRARGVDTIIARRIFPELFVETFGKLGNEAGVYERAGRLFGSAARSAGFKRIILEGRAWRSYKTHASPLYKVDNEIAAIGPSWSVSTTWKECAMLVPA